MFNDESFFCGPTYVPNLICLRLTHHQVKGMKSMVVEMINVIYAATKEPLHTSPGRWPSSFHRGKWAIQRIPCTICTRRCQSCFTKTRHIFGKTKASSRWLPIPMQPTAAHVNSTDLLHDPRIQYYAQAVITSATAVSSQHEINFSGKYLMQQNPLIFRNFHQTCVMKSPAIQKGYILKLLTKSNCDGWPID